MGIPFIAISVIFITVILNLRSNRSMRTSEDVRRAFWERERRANMTRKKSLQDLPYIRIPDDIPPDITAALSGEAMDAMRSIGHLREDDARIVNLTGYSNTDLKLEYGVANINDLILYDTNYTTLVTALQSCGQALFDAAKYEDAARTLEFAAQTGTDITATYRLLIDLYRTKLFLDPAASTARIRSLETIAETLRTPNKDRILAMIREASAKEEAPS